MKKQFNKNIVMTKVDDEDFENYTKCWICENVYVDGHVRVRDHCHTTRKHRGSAHRDCNINIKLNHKIPIIFHNLRKYDFATIMQELGKFYFKINDKPNRLEKIRALTSAFLLIDLNF